MNTSNCPSSRRHFLRTTAASAAALASGSAFAAPGTDSPKSETLVKTLYKSFTEEQSKALVFPFDHKLRTKVDNNWHITPKEKAIGKFLDDDQQQMVKEIFMNLHSDEYRDEVMKQVMHDNGRVGFGGSNIAIFGEPDSGKFELVLTSRHVTRRCDGDSVAGKAFGGPIFYGHAAGSFNEGPDHEGNVYWFQAKRANEVFQMLDGKQREQALLGTPRKERGNSTVELKGADGDLEGIAVADMTADQKDGVRKVLADLLMPFRKEDVDESMKLIEKAGFDKLSMAFFKNHDIGDDGVWDTWQVEGPNMIWLFRGKPHVHTWVHISDPDVA